MSRSGGSTFKRCGCRDPRTGRQLGRRCPHLRGRGHGSWYLAVSCPRHRTAGAGGTWPAGQAGRPAPPRRGPLHDRAVASGLAGRPAVAAAVDPPQLPAPPGHLPPAVHRQHPAGDADRRRPARDVHRDRPPKARGRRAAAYEGTAKPAWRFFGISSGPVRGPQQMHLVVQSPARDLPSATVRGGVTAERRRTGLRAEILSYDTPPDHGVEWVVRDAGTVPAKEQ